MSAAAPKPAAPTQLALDLPVRPALEAEDFLVSASNEEAVRLIDRWPDWPHWAVMVTGPARSGKSHLANVWRLKSAAIDFDSATLSVDALGNAVSSRTIVVEDIDRGIGAEQALFHLLNLAREHRLSILITAQKAPGDLAIKLPDLRSRLCALPLARIFEPDEVLLRAVLVKHFADRQLAVDPVTIDYLAMHMERSMEAAATIVAQIDAKALAARRKVTRTLASEVLVAMAGADG